MFYSYWKRIKGELTDLQSFIENLRNHLFRFISFWIVTILFKKILLFLLPNVTSVAEKYNKSREHLTPNFNFNYKAYKTSVSEYPLWVDKLYAKFKSNYIISTFIIVILIYLTALFFAYTIDFQSDYLNTFAVVLGCFGIFMTLSTIKYGSKNFHRHYEYVRPCFVIDDKGYYEVINTWFKRLSNNKAIFKQSIFFGCLFCFFAYLRFYQNDFLISIKVSAFEPKDFVNNCWYEGPYKIVKFFLMCYFALLVAFPLITAARILFINFFFLLDFRHLPVIPISNLIKGRLKGVTNMYIIITVFWLIGVALFGFLFFDKYDPIAISFISILSLFGVLTFLTPQIIYRLLLIKSQRLNSQLIISKFYTLLGGSVVERKSKYDLSPDMFDDFDVTSYVDFVDSSQIPDKWVYSPVQMLSFILGQAIAIASPEYKAIITFIQNHQL